MLVSAERCSRNRGAISRVKQVMYHILCPPSDSDPPPSPMHCSPPPSQMAPHSHRSTVALPVTSGPIHTGRGTQRATRCKQMGPVDVNGGVHTACKQHQRKNIPICTRCILRPVWIGPHCCSILVLYLECAHAFFKAGAKLILCARREKELQRVKDTLMQLPVVSRSLPATRTRVALKLGDV